MVAESQHIHHTGFKDTQALSSSETEEEEEEELPLGVVYLTFLFTHGHQTLHSLARHIFVTCLHSKRMSRSKFFFLFICCLIVSAVFGEVFLSNISLFFFLVSFFIAVLSLFFNLIVKLYHAHKKNIRVQ